MKIAVTGTGYWGVNLARVFKELGVLECICDINEVRLAELAQKYGVRSTNSYESVLGDASIDAVVIATPAITHHELARKALLAGKDVFVEKPITLQAADCEELIGIADRGNRLLMVGHLLLYHPAVLALKRLVDAGGIGKPQYLYSNRLNLGKVRREENALWSFAPHDISVILSLLGDRLPVSVSTTGGNYIQPGVADVTVSHLLFENDVRAHIFVSWLHPFKVQQLVVVGSDAMAAFDDVAANKLSLYTKNIELKNGQYVVDRPQATPISFDPAEPLKAECQHFIDCVARRMVPRSDGWNGLRVLQVLEACEQSLNNGGRSVDLPLTPAPKRMQQTAR